MPWSLPRRRGDGARHVQTQHIVKNRILRQLSADELKSVQPWLTLMALRSSVVLHAAGDPLEQVYFPVSGMISLLAVMQSGEAIETGIVGADGLVGGDSAINGHLFGQMTVQHDGAALTMPKARFVHAYLTHPHLRNLVDRYQSILLVQAQQNGACHALHSVRSRLCRWLLQSQDMIGSDTFSLTQEFLSHMLGVRRNTVSVEAHAVQEAGLIRYRRGHVTILNRDGLEDCSCECYSVIRAETDKLMGPAKT
ncbi:MAG: Crp/Fnr family transcriptional regulator [Alphaproteobacteria bacterium]|nr:MAG: Crp/Fnr family transcriptional regulator [Alphaproteobacteria bacterium]